MKKIMWTYGLIAGGIMSVMMFATLPFENEFSNSALIVGYTTIVLSFLSIYFGIRTYRDNAARGVGFGRAFGVGVLIAFIASCCYVASWQVISHTFMSDFPAKYEAATIKQLKTSGKSQADIDAGIAKAKQFTVMYKNPLFNVAITIIEPLPVGLVIALISAGVLSRKRRERSPSLESQAVG